MPNKATIRSKSQSEEPSDDVISSEFLLNFHKKNRPNPNPEKIEKLKEVREKCLSELQRIVDEMTTRNLSSKRDLDDTSAEINDANLKIILNREQLEYELSVTAVEPTTVNLDNKWAENDVKFVRETLSQNYEWYDKTHDEISEKLLQLESEKQGEQTTTDEDKNEKEVFNPLDSPVTDDKTECLSPIITSNIVDKEKNGPSHVGINPVCSEEPEEKTYPKDDACSKEDHNFFKDILFTCNECDETFKTKNRMKLHVKKVHRTRNIQERCWNQYGIRGMLLWKKKTLFVLWLKENFKLMMKMQKVHSKQMKKYFSMPLKTYLILMDILCFDPQIIIWKWYYSILSALHHFFFKGLFSFLCSCPLCRIVAECVSSHRPPIFFLKIGRILSL
jgi:hypothetical protein